MLTETVIVILKILDFEFRNLAMICAGSKQFGKVENGDNL